MADFEVKSRALREDVAQGRCADDQSFATVELLVIDELSEGNRRGVETKVDVEAETAGVTPGFLPRNVLKKLDCGSDIWMFVRPDGYFAAMGGTDQVGPATQWFRKFGSNQ